MQSLHSQKYNICFFPDHVSLKPIDQKEGQNCCFPELSSVPSPGGESPVSSMVTPARPFVKNTPASLYRQAGRNHRSRDRCRALASSLYWMLVLATLCFALFVSHSQGCRCVCHSGPSRSNSSIHAHAQEHARQCGEMEIIPLLCLKCTFQAETKWFSGFSESR